MLPRLKVLPGGADTCDTHDDDGNVYATPLLSAHLDHLRWRNCRPSTIVQRRNTVVRLGRWMQRPVIAATTEEILGFRDRRTLAGTPLAPNSQATELAHLGGFFRWAFLEGHRRDDPMLRVPRPKLPRGLPHPISEADLARAVDLASERVRPWLMLAAFAGLRACEIAPLRGEHLHLDEAIPVIVVHESKGGDEQVVPCSPVLRDEFAGHPRRGWLFPLKDGRLGPVAPHLVSHLANDHLHRVGIALTLHSLRHRFGTQIYRASGRDLRQTQELMRHRSPTSTAIYTLVDLDEAAGIVASLPGVHLAS